jgi:hypothetical protein
MTTRTSTSKDSHVLWQENEDGIEEPALLIEPFSDVISITQKAVSFNLTYEAVDEFCRVLKKIKAEK